jgi:hypothetical protein
MHRPCGSVWSSRRAVLECPENAFWCAWNPDNRHEIRLLPQDDLLCEERRLRYPRPAWAGTSSVFGKKGEPPITELADHGLIQRNNKIEGNHRAHVRV